MEFRGTTICAVKRFDRIAIAGDGQVTMGENAIFKRTARKVRKIYNDQVTIGFAGSVADAFTLSERFEEMLTQSGGNLERAAVNLAREWRGVKVDGRHVAHEVKQVGVGLDLSQRLRQRGGPCLQRDVEHGAGEAVIDPPLGHGGAEAARLGLVTFGGGRLADAARSVDRVLGVAHRLAHEYAPGDKAARRMVGVVGPEG